MTTLTQPNTKYFVLDNLSWQTYQSILKDWGDERTSRLAFNQGKLEVQMPSELHEITKAFLETIVSAIVFELEIAFKATGSVTLDREDLVRGVEPDASYYFQNASKVRGIHIDLTKQPPPDLVIEVDITHPSTSKLPIYATLGVPEIWLYDGKELYIYHLQKEQYLKAEHSLAFPVLSTSYLTNLIKRLETDEEHLIIRDLRAYLRSKAQRYE